MDATIIWDLEDDPKKRKRERNENGTFKVSVGTLNVPFFTLLE